MSNYDLVIVGGGMVGLSLAAALRDSDLRIAVVDGKPVATEWPADSVDMRVSAITRASQYLFEHTGAWAGIGTEERSPYRAMEVWDGQGTGRIRFDAAMTEQPDLGHILENRVLRRAFWQRLQGAANVDLRIPERCASVRRGERRAQLQLEGGETLSARLLVAADGANSWLRQHSDIGLHSESYEQSALVATVRTTEPHRQTAWQRFSQYGPLAFLPLVDPHLCSIVWSQDTDQAADLMALPTATFEERLTSTFEGQLGSVTLASQRAAFPLLARRAETLTAPRLALIGDAAHTLHPLAGQGVNIGFTDAAALAGQLLDVHGRGGDIGARAHLRPWERSRISDIRLMMAMMKGFKELFGSDHPGILMARNLGLSGVDRLPLAKRLLMRHALGLAGELPALCRQP